MIGGSGMMTSLRNDRPKVALYALVRTQRERLCYVLARSFCVDCGWDYVEYVDNANPVVGDASAWWRLLADIESGQYYALVVFQDVPNLEAYCQHHGTNYALIHPDTSAASSGSWRSKRASRR